MPSLLFDYKHAGAFLPENWESKIQQELNVCHAELVNKTGKGNDFLGWIDLPAEMDKDLLGAIEKDAQAIRQKAEILVVIGIGGSYLGSRAVIEALSSPFASLQPSGNPIVLFAGNNISQDYHADLIRLLDKKEYAIVVISKSGTTTEPAIAFRLLKAHIENKYGKKEASARIIAVTDRSRGALKGLADKEGYTTYVIPDDVGGRYSVLTPVGLLPIAVAGFDVRSLVAGAVAMRAKCLQSANMGQNPAATYAAVRTQLYRDGRSVEIMVNYEPMLHFFTEWWKQLYGESDGKQGEGLFPAGVDFTADLHSMGQYIQEGRRLMFETVLQVGHPKLQLEVPRDDADADGLNFLAGMKLHQVNAMAASGTVLAHIDGNVPNLAVSIPLLNEASLGELIYFYEFACGLSGYLLGVNPFDQPGVEAYKKNMFALLGKPGFEAETKALKARLGI